MSLIRWMSNYAPRFGVSRILLAETPLILALQRVRLAVTAMPCFSGQSTGQWPVTTQGVVMVASPSTPLKVQMDVRREPTDWVEVPKLKFG